MPTLAPTLTASSPGRHALGERGEDPLGDDDDVLRPVEAVEQHGELVAAEARDGVGRAHALAQALGDRDQQLVADRVAERVVDGLEVVDVDEQHGDGRIGLGERLVDAVDEQRAVGQTRERVVVGLVLELVLELAQLPDGLLEAVVLERDRGVGGERLEQPQVGVGEVADDAGAVGEQHRAHHARLPRQHREHRVRDPALLQVAAQAHAAAAGRDAGDGLVVVDQRAQLVGDRGVDRHHLVAHVAGAVRGAQRRVALGGEQDDLGDLGAERLDRAREQALERADDLRRARQRARGLVEELEALVALALGGVGAVGEEDGDERHDQQRQRARVVDDDHGGGEAEARVGRGDREVHQQHAAERLGAEPALGERDRGADQQHGHERRRLAGDQREDPGQRAEAVDRRREDVEDDDREAGRERELRDVEDDLDRRQAAVDEQHDDRPDEPGHRRGRSARRTAGRRRAAGRRARTSARCGGSAGGPRSARPRGSPARAPTTGCARRRRRPADSGRGRRAGATEAATIAMLSVQTPRSADSRRRAPFPGDMGASSAPRAEP